MNPSLANQSPRAYRVPRARAPLDLFLDGNEGSATDASVLEAFVAGNLEGLRRYPDGRALEARIAARFGLEQDRVLVTAGADEALDRTIRAFLRPGRELVLPVPTFEMIERYAALAGGIVREIEWSCGAFPTEAVIAAVNQATALVALVSPNNPTGAVATAKDIDRVAHAAGTAIVLCDLAYAEFADEDLTRAALELDNTLVVRTFSKAHGLAGLRVGYAIGSRETIARLRATGSPYPVAGPSLAAASASLERDLSCFVDRVRLERAALVELLRALGLDCEKSEGNFVLARAKDESRALWIRDALAGCGIAVRAFPGRQRLESSLRVTCPGDEKKFTRLAGALELVRQPQAICFDLDGVLADVSQSYRRAIVECARSFGVDVSATDIGELKARGNANNDWVVTQRLLARAGVEVPLEFVTRQFESLYQGEDGRAGLCASERLLVEPERWRAWAGRLPLAVVTGRPRRDAERFLAEHELAGSVAALICMEDAEPKPSPRPIELARARLGVSRVWMLGDTRDDIESARAAGALPIGVVAPGEDFERSSETLFAAGAARVLAMTTELEDLWPW